MFKKNGGKKVNRWFKNPSSVAVS